MVSKLVWAPDTLDKITKEKRQVLEHRATDPHINRISIDHQLHLIQPSIHQHEMRLVCNRLEIARSIAIGDTDLIHC